MEAGNNNCPYGVIRAVIRDLLSDFAKDCGLLSEENTVMDKTSAANIKQCPSVCSPISAIRLDSELTSNGKSVRLGIYVEFYADNVEEPGYVIVPLNKTLPFSAKEILDWARSEDAEDICYMGVSKASRIFRKMSEREY